MPNGDDEQRRGAGSVDEQVSASYAASFDPGDHERSGWGGYEGKCAACSQWVSGQGPCVILYHPSIKGGIFHTRCAPTGGQWFGVGEKEE